MNQNGAKTALPQAQRVQWNHSVQTGFSNAFRAMIEENLWLLLLYHSEESPNNNAQKRQIHCKNQRFIERDLAGAYNAASYPRSSAPQSRGHQSLHTHRKECCLAPQALGKKWLYTGWNFPGWQS
jgi:hypothetical protein